MDVSRWKYQFKIIMLGCDNVRKSCLLERYIKGLFPEHIYATIVTGLSIHYLEVEPGVIVKLQLFDTPGLEFFRTMMHVYVHNSAGCLLVFDLSDYNSFSYLKRWHTELIKSLHPHTAHFVLVGHKSDRNEWEVTREEAELLASEFGAQYIEASAKTGHNVVESFEMLTRHIYQGILQGEVQAGVTCSTKNNNDVPAEDNKCCAS
ncbi:ras-related protein Rab-39A-like [Myxocyprinus asiaticus]|uniref:ras-related protein Rab-39A-like n=1 Tax=Myxocyprinus asiaticus TaxID=70543 RepID=UPI002222E889|nr:ras-related protein Rab-39A-like [Myxocyprinus asiaticus]